MTHPDQLGGLGPQGQKAVTQLVTNHIKSPFFSAIFFPSCFSPVSLSHAFLPEEHILAKPKCLR